MTAADPTFETGYQQLLVDVTCKGDLLRSWRVLIGMCGGALAAIVLVIVVRARGSTSSEMFLVTSLLLAAAFAGWLGYQGVQQRAARRLHRRLAACSGAPIQSRIGDGIECDGVVGTKPELETTLRAWLSPLPPPPIEQLSDLR
jgi:hypothetical protein